MIKKDTKTLKKVMTIITAVTTVLLVCFIFYGIRLGVFSSGDVLIDKIKTYGLLGPIFFLLIQIVQVIFPVIPGGASCLAGVLAFGPFYGFVYNYVGLCVGSIVAFYISRCYGLPLIEKLFEEKTIKKYLGYIQSKKFETIFFWGILLPGAPDDLLCYIAGISGMEKKKFIFIILLCKPLTLLFYSCFMKYFHFALALMLNSC